jgi:hypothetical protein
MKTLRHFALTVAVVSLALATAAHAADAITLKSLLAEMVDRDALARFPEPAYVCSQASSYDRDATAPDNPQTWFANWDRSQFVRIDEKDGKKEYVLMDQDGPGAVVRIWATWHGPGGGPFSDGTLRIYIDGADQPVIEGPASKVLDGGVLTGAPLSEGVSPQTPYAQQGHNLYLPIPYAKHIKVTYSTGVPVDRGAHEGEALYYQINYRTYDKAIAVESFSMGRLEAARSAVDAANRTLAANDRGDDADWQTLDLDSLTLQPGASTDPVRLTGPAAIRELQCKLNADDLEQAIRSTVIEISFDGEQTVWCPVGDFCGTGYKLRPHVTWYTRVDVDGTLSTAWIMPFEREAVVRLRNVGKQPVTIAAKIRHSKWNWDDRSMHFHATWRQLTETKTGGKKEMNGANAFDVNYVTATGQGVYVGDTLTLCNGAADWWGEGDEKVFVDGESFPSHFGTGTEDYYGYAWARPEFFNSPFHAQPDGGGNLAGGYSVNSRYRSLDAIPFTKSLKFDMELWHWADTKINFAPSTFWYGRPGATSNVEPDAESAAKPIARERHDLVPVYREAGAIEGESLKVVEVTGGRAEPQRAGFGWSDDAQLWWMDGAVGDTLVVEFLVDQTGNRHVIANLTKAVDYAIVEVSVNDDPPTKVDRFNRTVAQDQIDLGAHDLEQGPNRLTIKIVGEHPDAVPRRMFGLDYLKFD